jgi:membrane protease YdiL (CAAX protease family)
VAALVPSVVLLVYGNLATLVVWQPGQWPTIPAVGHLLFVAVALAWALGPAQLSLAALGLGRVGWRRSTLLGLGVGGLMALLVLAPLVAFRAVGWHSTTALPFDGGALAVRAVRLLLASAVCEELWFRGLLQACWGRVLGPVGGILVSAVLFAAWHLVVWGWTLSQVAIQPPLPLALTYPAGLAVLAFAGGFFGWLRQATGHLVGPVVAHWLIVLVLTGLVRVGWL